MLWSYHPFRIGIKIISNKDFFPTHRYNNPTIYTWELVGVAAQDFMCDLELDLIRHPHKITRLFFYQRVYRLMM